jgi:hypothetical protein
MKSSIYQLSVKLFREYMTFLITKKRAILYIMISFAGLGILVALLRPIKYTARSSFVVEDSKSIGGSGLMGALSGQFGSEILNVLGAGSNLLSGENIIELSKSRSLIRKTLLTPYDSTQYSLADKYAETSLLKKKWKRSKKVGAWISFSTEKKSFTRTEDSLLNNIIDRIIKKDIRVFKPDRRLSLFEINITMRDDQLANLFCQRLLNKTSDLYIEAKTKRIRGNINRLQSLADSLQDYANGRIKKSLTSNFRLLDINPQYLSESVNSRIDEREEVLSSTVYAEILKNLEISKVSLLQETPTIQLVDTPIIPLPDNKIEWHEGLIGGILTGVVINILLFAFIFAPSQTVQKL